MECRCNLQFVEAMGLPQCGPIPERIVKMFFTPDLRALSLVQDTQNIPQLAPSLNYEVPWLYEPDVNNTNFDLWRYLWALVTPTLDLVESERAEAVREEIGGNSYFVRYSTRSFSVTVAKKSAEFGRLLAQLRCYNQLGVLLLDSNGVLWGVRATQYTSNQQNLQEVVRPIEINTATIDERMVFAGDTTVQKWQFSFQLNQNVMDYNFVPIYYDKRLLAYLPPIELNTSVISRQGNTARIAVFARFAVGAMETVRHIEIPAPTAHNAQGAPITPDPTNISRSGNVYVYDNIPTAAASYRYTTQWLRSNGGAYNYYSFRIQL